MTDFLKIAKHSIIFLNSSEEPLTIFLTLDCENQISYYVVFVCTHASKSRWRPVAAMLLLPREECSVCSSLRPRNFEVKVQAMFCEMKDLFSKFSRLVSLEKEEHSEFFFRLKLTNLLLFHQKSVACRVLPICVNQLMWVQITRATNGTAFAKFQNPSWSLLFKKASEGGEASEQVWIFK